MSVTVELKGKLEPVSLEGSFIECVNALNINAAQGKQFIITRLETGQPFAMNMPNILTITDDDEEMKVPSAI